MWGKLAYAVIAAAVSYLVSYLLMPKPPKTPLDDSKTEPSVRGTILPILLGHFRVGSTMGWVGGRLVTQESLGGGKGGGDDPTQNIYHERGMHMICVGEGRSLIKIFQQGKVIWEGDVRPSDTPSGSTVDLGTEGRFQIYWGEDTQPVCTGLAGYTGVNSAYPHIFYVYWNTKRLGTNPVWPQLEYEVTVDSKALPSGGLVGDSFFEGNSFVSLGNTYDLFIISGTIAGQLVWRLLDPYIIRVADPSLAASLEVGMRMYLPYTGYAGEITKISSDSSYSYISSTVAMPPWYVASLPPSGYYGWFPGGESFDFYGWPYWGVSPACSLEQFIFHPRPWGAGFDRSLFDDSLQDVYDLLVDEETPCTSLLKSGRSWKDGVASVMQDMGIMLYFDQDTGLYGFKPIREEVAAPLELSFGDYDPDQIEEQFAYSVLAADKRIFTFKDSARKFKDSTILLTDDATAQYGADPNAKQVGLETLTSFPSASRAAARRDREANVDGVLSTDVSYAVEVRVGDAVTFEGLSKTYRVASVKSNPDEAKKSVGFIEDVYSVNSNYIEQGPVGLNPGNRTQPAPDPYVKILETNRFVTPDINGYHLIRIRYSEIITLAYIYDSPDDVTYSLNGNQTAATGGILTEDIALDTAGIIDEGPQFEVSGDDIDFVQDLSSSEGEWRSGVQMCNINDELFFLKAVTAIGSGVYRLDGLLRARYGTTRQEHVIGSTVFIFNQTSLKVFNEPWVSAGRDIYVKSVPAASTGSVAIDDVNAVGIIPYQGGGYRPLQPANLTTSDWTSAWEAGEDVLLRWDYKNASSKAGAGVPLSDEPAELSLPEGYFKLEFYEGATLKKTVTEISLGEYTYSNASLVSDFGGEPTSFDVKLVEVFNGLTSPAEEATITKV